MNIYDFDKTIYDGDSTLDFYFFCLKKHPKLIFHIPIQIFGALLYLVGIYNKVRFKEAFYTFLNSLNNVDSLIENFWKSHEFKIKDWYMKKKQSEDLIISASPEFLLKPICNQLKVNGLIASKVDKHTGKYDGDNCYGENKVKRLNDEIQEYVINEFYSDSLSDEPLAKLAMKSYFVDGNNISSWSDYKPKGLKGLIRNFY